MVLCSYVFKLCIKDDLRHQFTMGFVCEVLPMGLLIATYVFQAAICGLFLDMEQVVIYIDDIIILGCGKL